MIINFVALKYRIYARGNYFFIIYLFIYYCFTIQHTARHTVKD